MFHWLEKPYGRLLGRLRMHLEAVSYSLDIIVARLAMPILLQLLSNKWLKPRVPEGCVIHCDIVDAIGGWKTSGIGHGYGNGYPLEVLEKWVNAMANA